VAAESSLWRDVVVHDSSARWYTLLHRSQSVDLWLLAWSPDQDTDWHDHGGSSGSFAVADGVLEERYRRGAYGRTARRLLGSGQVAAFGPAHVHNVSHDGTAPATSIHAYSPPLVAMTYYDLTPRGLFARTTVAVEGPEGSRGRGTGASLSSASQLADALPPGRGIDELLAEARSGLIRLRPEAALAALTDGAVLVDIRPLEERIAEGEVPGALIIGRNVLEWRLDPRSEARIAGVARFELRVIVMCQEGYVSSLAAANLRRIGLTHASDLDGGFRAWKSAGLPTVPFRLGS
jgi:rhodanese-related sulfurtransferase